MQFSQSGTRQLSSQWWYDLDDSALHTLIDQALGNNLSLLAIRQRLLQAQAIARQAGADLSPSLDAIGSARKDWTRRDGFSDSNSNLLLGLAADYELDLWGRLQSKEEAALLDARATSGNIRSDFPVAVTGSMNGRSLEGMAGNGGSRTVTLKSSSGNIILKEIVQR